MKNNGHSEASAVVRPRSRGFVIVLIVVVVLLALIRINAFFDGRELRLGTEKFGFLEIIVTLCITVSVIGLFVTSFFTLFYRFYRHSYISYVHLGCLLLLPLACAAPNNLYLLGVKKRLMPIDEAAYVHFAQDMRVVAGSSLDPISFDPDYMGVSTEKPKAEKAMKVLMTSVFGDWPRRFLIVVFEDDSVTLSRGTGMLGTIGVKIFDGRPLRQETALKEMQAFPQTIRVIQLSPRVQFFLRSD